MALRNLTFKYRYCIVRLMDGAVSGKNLEDEVASLEKALDEYVIENTELERELESVRYDVRVAALLGFLSGVLAAILAVAT